jgi:hypothetical protein
MKLRLLLGGLALAAAIAGSRQRRPVKIGFITKFPVPFFATMEDAAKAYAAANPGVEIIFGQGASATDIEGQIALIESMVTQGVQGIALTPVDPTVATALDRAIAAGREGRPDGQRHPRLGRPHGARHHRQLRRRQDRRRAPGHGAEGRRHARHPRGRARRALARRPRQRHARGSGRRQGRTSSAAAPPTAPKNSASTWPRTC